MCVAATSDQMCCFLGDQAEDPASFLERGEAKAWGYWARPCTSGTNKTALDRAQVGTRAVLFLHGLEEGAGESQGRVSVLEFLAWCWAGGWAGCWTIMCWLLAQACPSLGFSFLIYRRRRYCLGITKALPALFSHAFLVYVLGSAGIFNPQWGGPASYLPVQTEFKGLETKGLSSRCCLPRKHLQVFLHPSHLLKTWISVTPPEAKHFFLVSYGYS